MSLMVMTHELVKAENRLLVAYHELRRLIDERPEQFAELEPVANNLHRCWSLFYSQVLPALEKATVKRRVMEVA